VNGIGSEAWLFVFHEKLSAVSYLFSIFSFQFLVLSSQRVDLLRADG
jgi:hypothetical protein